MTALHILSLTQCVKCKFVICSDTHDVGELACSTIVISDDVTCIK